eukprot:UN20055
MQWIQLLRCCKQGPPPSIIKSSRVHLSQPCEFSVPNDICQLDEVCSISTLILQSEKDFCFLHSVHVY